MAKFNSKPSWDDAPEWAGYLAMDSDGEWSWFEFRPSIKAKIFDSDKGRYIRASLPRWHQSLEERPE